MMNVRDAVSTFLLKEPVLLNLPSEMLAKFVTSNN